MTVQTVNFIFKYILLGGIFTILWCLFIPFGFLVVLPFDLLLFITTLFFCRKQKNENSLKYIKIFFLLAGSVLLIIFCVSTLKLIPLQFSFWIYWYFLLMAYIIARFLAKNNSD